MAYYNPCLFQFWCGVKFLWISSPISNEFEAVLVVVDRLSKYSHFIPLKHPYTAQELQDRDEALRQLKQNLLKAQEQMKLHGDKQRKEVKFEVGDWVFLKL
ncbi:hypothetical protein A2U01_0044266, partial [Trifolium medium]|nr:hypothetical protein [Trifolium medium]